jgi:hypothetical protein
MNGCIWRAEKQAAKAVLGQCRRDGCHKPPGSSGWCEPHHIWAKKRREIEAKGEAAAAAEWSALRAYDAPCDCLDCLARLDPEWEQLDWAE